MSIGEFYPPRARGIGRLRRIWFAAHRSFCATPKVVAPGLATYFRAIAVPCYGIYIAGYTLFATIAAAAYALALLALLSELGHPIARYAAAFLLGSHSVSALIGARFLSNDTTSRDRLQRGATVVLLLIALYIGMRGLLGMIIAPLSFHNRPYIVNRLALKSHVQTGDLVAFNIPQTRSVAQRDEIHGMIFVEAGYGMGDVLAVPGDRVEFTASNFRVNEIIHSRRPRMPDSGSFLVPEKHWFIWPDFAINSLGQAASIQADTMVAQMALVRDDQFVGSVCRHWFWRKQL